MNLKSWEEEYIDCVVRCAAAPDANDFHLLHHNGSHIERLTGPIEERLEWIRTRKHEDQRALRFHLISPWLGPITEAWAEAGKTLDKAQKAFDEARKALDEVQKAWEQTTEFQAYHAEHFPDCPWNGSTICEEWE